jgi:ribosome maturation factor RimP
MTESEKLYNDIATLLTGIGLDLVDLGVSRHKGSTQVRAVVYNANGTGIDECSKAHRLIAARLETVLADTDFSLETASPGIDRIIRADREYSIFTGRGIRLFLEDEDVIAGRIASADATSVLISTPDGDHSIAFERIRKAKLDYSQEGR